MINTLLSQLSILNPYKIEQCQNKEDGSLYNVWKIEKEDKKYILKQAKGYEKVLYETLLKKVENGVPKYYGATRYNDIDYVLIEYIEGVDLCKCNRDLLIKTLDALIEIQNQFWDIKLDVGYTYEDSLKSCLLRKDYLKNPLLEKTYEEFLKIYQAIPKTLCHHDLLPFNVIVGGKGYLIDWEYAGILPYASSITRLIAHGKNDVEYLFYMNDEDKKFAVEYYYENLIKAKGITYQEYIKTINYFLFYEYTEWIMLGNKYKDADMDRFNYYMKLSLSHIEINNL